MRNESTETTPLYKPTDNVFMRMSAFAKNMNILEDGLFSGFSKRTNAKIEWEYLSIHAIRGVLNRIMGTYGLHVHTRAEAPLPNMLPEEDVIVNGTLFARAWQNAVITNIDDPKDVHAGSPTRAEVPFENDKSITKAKQLAAKSALIGTLNIAVGEDPDESLHELPLDDANAKKGDRDNLIFKLPARHLERLRALITQHGFTEAPLLAEVSRGAANRLELPLTAQTIRALMAKLKIDDNAINNFISKLTEGTGSDATVPESAPNTRNAALALRRGIDALSENARTTFLRSNGIKPEHLAHLSDAQAAPLVNRLNAFARTIRQPRDIQPASRRNTAASTR